MIMGCFALVEPFTPLERQFAALSELGIAYADITDSHDGASLGAEFGFAATASLDGYPGTIRDMAARHGITLVSVCAHANLLDPTSPERYGTAQIIKSIRLAHLLGISEVITTEGDPKTAFGRALRAPERLFTIREKLQAPIEWAEYLGIRLLLETHGIVTDSVEGMETLLAALGHEDTIGICLDTGNSWLGGADPIDFVRTFGPRIRHVHWKDMPAGWESRRGTLYGCGMAVIPLGDGVVDLQGIIRELRAVGFDGPTTLEVAGTEHVRRSIQRLREWTS
ncbi:MAG: sugar phosphate isomerase/epimerase [Lentisphaeria bacterium]|nr:sugar phosphate isomerase/epimerase [Lentisphaeria bacterium]